MKVLRRFYPVAAFLGGFVWDALTIGQRVRALDLWRLGGFLFGAGLLVTWLAFRESRKRPAPPAGSTLRDHLADLVWQAPFLLLQFFFGGIFSALFILYFKSSGHLGTLLTTAGLGTLLVANEFAGKRYGRHFTLVWAFFALNAILLCNFALPHALGSLDPRWFYVSTALGMILTQAVWWLSPGRPGRILPAWGVAAVLLFAWIGDMIAPVPLVNQQLAVGQPFVQANERFSLTIEQAPRWQFWRDQSPTVHVAEGARLYGVSAVFAPLGVTAMLAHRWEKRENGHWQLIYSNSFASTGGRERGFRGYSWVLSPAPGQWRLSVATQDGRTIGNLGFTVVRGEPHSETLLTKDF